MSYRVQFDSSPVYELILSFMIYSRRKWTRNLDIGNGWLKSVDESMKPVFRKDSAQFDEATFDHLYLLAYLSPKKSSVPEFLQWLGGQSAGHLYELLCHQTAGPLPNNLEETMQEAVRLLLQWNKLYYSTVDPGWLEAAASDAQQRRSNSFNAAPAKIVEAATGGVVLEPNERLTEVVLAPAVHFRPLNTYAIYKSLGLILYPVDPPPSDADEPPPQLLRLTRALADESRIRILRYLAPSPRSFTEVVANTGLSKGTVHHHMMGLRAAGLIRTHINSGQLHQERFSIRPDGVSQCTEYLQAYIGY